MRLREALGLAPGRAAATIDGLPVDEVETEGWLDDLLDTA